MTDDPSWLTGDSGQSVTDNETEIRKANIWRVMLGHYAVPLNGAIMS